MHIHYLFLIILKIIHCYWWLYDTEDHEELFNKQGSIRETTFMEDQGKCMSIYNDSCYLVNSELRSNDSLINKCCLLKISEGNEFCTTIFSGKYFQGNLYSIDYAYNHNFTYDCDGDGNKTFSSSDYNPTETWEIYIKERYDCIYSETKEECQANPKSFLKNTKCCWFSNGEIYDMASCFGIKELTDEQFNTIIPYLTRARLYNSNKTMDFSCYDKSDKITSGTFNLEFNYIMMSSLEEKMAYELESDEVLSIFAKKQSFIGIKDYDYSNDYHYNNFRMYSISPDGSIDKVFTISTRFKYKITSEQRRNLQENEEIEKIIPCYPETVDTDSSLNITLSKCQFEKEEGKEIEKIDIQKGNDLIGNFEDGKNEIYEGQTFLNDNDINKIKQSATFTFKNPEPNIKTNEIEGETTEDRRNVNFVIYHTENSKVQTIQGKASFLKDSSTISFTMTPSINLNNGITIIPNQIAQGENGEYLYFQNKIGTIIDNDKNDDSNGGGGTSGNGGGVTSGNEDGNGLSTKALIAIIICSVVLLISIAIILGILIKKKIKKKQEQTKSDSINIENNK